MNYKEMLEKFAELEAKLDQQDSRLKLLEERFWYTAPVKGPSFTPATLPNPWPDNFFKDYDVGNITDQQKFDKQRNYPL